MAARRSTGDAREHLPPYVAVEGLKGAGKSTVITAVRQRLRAGGVKATPLDPTAPGFQLHPLELAYRLAGANVDWVRERVYAYRSNRQGLALRPGPDCNLILGDRSFITTLATRWIRAKTVGVSSHFERCRQLEWAIPLPSDVIYIDVPIDILRKRIEARNRRYGAGDERREMLTAAASAYDAISRSRLPELARIRWHVVNGDKAVDQVAAEVLGAVYAITNIRQ